MLAGDDFEIVSCPECSCEACELGDRTLVRCLGCGFEWHSDQDDWDRADARID